MPDEAIVTLLTDFGASDPFVGVMKGVVLSLARGSALVDLSHDVEPGRIADAAFWLAQAYPWFPAGTVHLAVVDPGVGTSREALVLRAAGHWFVGPDNGLFEVVLRRVNSFECRRLDVGRLGLAPQSSTFHGRDVFAPVAGLLASRRLDFEGVGPRHEPLATHRVPEPRAVDGGFEGEVLVVDRFGNLITNVEAPTLGDLETTRVEILGRMLEHVRTYGELSPGGAAFVVGSFGQLEVVERDGSAARTLGAQRGTPLRVHRQA